MIYHYVAFFDIFYLGKRCDLKSKRTCFSGKDLILSAFKKNKLKLLIILICTLIALFTGVIIAIKTKSFNVFSTFLGDVESLNKTNFWLRLLSMLVVFGFVILGAINDWMSLFAILFISYRAFLMGGNIALLVMFNGLSGIVISLVVVIPCQLISLALFILFYLLLCEGRIYRKCYGSDRFKNYWLMIILIGVGCFVLLCLLESFFIWLISPKVIFVF